ncbi:putative replication factor-A protein 1 [Dimargaris cristalligena]|uniref:Replication protein A subunit n=1 Tax=Dimargaris cristalligena TaxID=215637 RepID=A0A4Q0A454_9FUNG|nr:putative replication factor-A protein 1 [Dimargaris cristalligena]|eukprot:RKP40040.1 putative replication factor-A protein 1 [Dimargaris cristalligena]
MTALTQGAVEAVFREDRTSPLAHNPVLQVLALRQMQQPPTDSNTGGPPPIRFRLLLSDGVNTIHGMLTTQLFHLITSGQLQANTVFRATQYTCNRIKEKPFMVLLQIEIVHQASANIGAPVPVGAPADVSSAAAVSAPAPAPVNPAATSYSTPRAPSNNVNNSSSVGGGGAPPPNVIPIRGLNPYQGKATIQARVTQKSDMRFWRNAKGEGKLFSVNLLDESGEIKATAFNEMADSLINVLEEGKVYYIANPKVNMARAQFNTLQNEYELGFERTTEVTLCTKAANVPSIKYNFVPLDRLNDHEKDAHIDVIGVVKEVSPVTELISKNTQKPYSKRDIQLMDMSRYAVRLTLWGKYAQDFNGDDHPVLAIKGVKVGDFGGRCLSLMSTATVSANPDIPEAHRLRGWFDSEQHSIQPLGYSSMGGGGGGDFGGMAAGGAGQRRDARKNLAQVKDENLGNGEKPDYFSTRGTITYIKADNFAYPACPNDGCQKKVVNNGSAWRCEKCDQSFPNPQYRYIMTINTCDHAGQIWLQCFNEVAEQLLGITANELEALRESDPTAFKQTIEAPLLKTYLFRCKAKAENYNDSRKVRYQIFTASPIDFVQESNQLIQAIENYS